MHVSKPAAEVASECQLENVMQRPLLRSIQECPMLSIQIKQKKKVLNKVNLFLASFLLS